MAPYRPTEGTAATVYYTANTDDCTSAVRTQQRLYIGIIEQRPPDPIDLERKLEDRDNLRKAQRVNFRHARSDQRHREKWRYHRRLVRHGKAELKREKARNKIRQARRGVEQSG